MWHKVISFSNKNYYRYQKFINGALDAIFCTTVFLICYFIDHTFTTALMGLGLYLFYQCGSHIFRWVENTIIHSRLSSELIMNLIILCHFLYMTSLTTLCVHSLDNTQYLTVARLQIWTSLKSLLRLAIL